MILAYSELLKRITGIKEQQLEEPFRILSRNNTTKMRMRVIKGLAQHEPTTIGKLLQELHFSRGGGSYLTIQKYFLDLKKEGLLEAEKRKTTTLWKFSEKGSELKKYMTLM